MEVAAGLLGFVEKFYLVAGNIQMSEPDSASGQYGNIMARVTHAKAFYSEVVGSWQSSPPPELVTLMVHIQLQALMKRLDTLEHTQYVGVRGNSKRSLALKDAEIVLNDFEMMISRLYQITLQRQVTQLTATTQSMHKILLVVAELLEYPVEVATGESGTERNHNIEAMRAKLHETLAANPMSHQPMGDPFCFAFVVLPVNADGGGVEPARGRVKIDTGAEDNWISTRMLERASVTFTPDDSLGTFLGANRQPFKPLGRVSITWYSDNEAQTQTSDFFVKENVPFDAILGGGWVLEECLNVFRKPVLPLFRMTMGPDEFNDLKKRQEATKASNDEVAALQRIEKRARRERERQEEARSRALSRITSPATLTRRNSSSSLSTFPSFVTSRSNAGSSTPGIPAQGSATAGTESQVPGDNSKGKGKEGSNAATVL